MNILTRTGGGGEGSLTLGVGGCVGAVTVQQIGILSICMQDVHNILLYCIVIIKPVTGRARICLASLNYTPGRGKILPRNAM